MFKAYQKQQGCTMAAQSFALLSARRCAQVRCSLGSAGLILEFNGTVVCFKGALQHLAYEITVCLIHLFQIPYGWGGRGVGDLSGQLNP